MGKTTFAPNPETSAAITSASTASGILLSGFDNSQGAEHFALVTHGLDRHRLRIFNVRSGTVNNDYTAEEKERFTCLSWGSIHDDGELGQLNSSLRKRKSSSTTKQSSTLTKVVILGTQSGSILMYSLAHGDIVKRLENVHTQPVTDFTLNKAGTKGYSIGEDNYIVEWNIEEGHEIMKWKADAKNVRRLKLSHSETKLATAGHTISLWDVTERKVIKKYTGHASAVLNLAFSQQDDVLVSIAEDDRYINVWDAQANNNNTSNITALTLEDNATHVHFSSVEPSLLVVSEDGTCGIWQNASATLSVRNGPPRRKIMRGAMTRPADTTISVLASQDDQTKIPIFSARFVSDYNGRSVMIARGSSIKPMFEVVPYINEESGAILENITLSRQLITNYLIDDSSLAIRNLKKTSKSYDESKVNVVGNTDYTIQNPSMADNNETSPAELTIEQKLEAMEMAKENDDDDDTGNNKIKLDKSRKTQQKQTLPLKVPSVQSLQNALVQALHSNDNTLLEGCLSYRNPDIIATTVRRLPTSYVIPLLRRLIERFQGKPSRAQDVLCWIQPVLQIHTAYLMTVPDLVGKLSNFYQAIDTRLSVLPKLMALNGRLDIVNSQIDSRTHKLGSLSQHTNRDEKPSTVYVEQVSDDEAEQMDQDDDDDSMDDMELSEDLDDSDDDALQMDSNIESEEE
ncbi:WD40-repeat-containing domain protein [Halteromyces radiatus]|uniref:WD40-repeat-containing domain protein n=1 Tax=Halteromyces radiatus TaxID=101107 RepID=UPI00221FB332|nr:WD40-repeat-containing domain protein [Halteromyces radiatus]KAI8093213.1 WD40-repeat-containing domain protein [Halteromyces radiatus]